MEVVLVLVMWLKLLVSVEYLIVVVSFITSSGAGADFVMMGGMLAGHDQSGECVMQQSWPCRSSNSLLYSLFFTGFTVYQH